MYVVYYYSNSFILIGFVITIHNPANLFFIGTSNGNEMCERARRTYRHCVVHGYKNRR